jgi:type IV pilus assembly protein PilM
MLNLNNLNFKVKPVQNLTGVGLDISSNSLKIIQLNRRWGKAALSQWGKKTIPARVVSRGVVEDHARLSELLYSLFQSLGLERPKVVAAVSSQQVFIRHLSLPPMPAREIRSAIGYQVRGGLLPIPPEEAVLDFMVAGLDRRLSSRKSIEVLIVAVRRLVVERLQTSLCEAGAVLQALELEPLALHRTISMLRPALSTGQVKSVGSERSFSRPRIRIPFLVKPELKPTVSLGPPLTAEAESSVLLINVEPGLVKFSLFGGELLRFNRTVSLNQQTDWASTTALANAIAAEAWRTIDYYQIEYPRSRVEKVLFTGDGISQTEKIAAALADQIVIPVEPLDPLRGIWVDQSATPEELAEIQKGYGVALGLAIRGLNQNGRF